ncbi:hypothetical protein TURU_126950 [Turdus rufiventris]|nr:hypothetical protein TURU_126950 [Turdus rufiventris]
MDDLALLDLLECPVCFEKLDATAKVLPCQHTFCKPCLQRILKSQKELRCPECRTLVLGSIEQLPSNLLLIRLLDGVRCGQNVSRFGSIQRSGVLSSPASIRRVPRGLQLHQHRLATNPRIHMEGEIEPVRVEDAVPVRVLDAVQLVAVLAGLRVGAGPAEPSSAAAAAARTRALPRESPGTGTGTGTGAGTAAARPRQRQEDIPADEAARPSAAPEAAAALLARAAESRSPSVCSSVILDPREPPAKSEAAPKPPASAPPSILVKPETSRNSAEKVQNPQNHPEPPEPPRTTQNHQNPRAPRIAQNPPDPPEPPVPQSIPLEPAVSAKINLGQTFRGLCSILTRFPSSGNPWGWHTLENRVFVLLTQLLD